MKTAFLVVHMILAYGFATAINMAIADDRAPQVIKMVLGAESVEAGAPVDIFFQINDRGAGVGGIPPVVYPLYNEGSKESGDVRCCGVFSKVPADDEKYTGGNWYKSRIHTNRHAESGIYVLPRIGFDDLKQEQTTYLDATRDANTGKYNAFYRGTEIPLIKLTVVNKDPASVDVTRPVIHEILAEPGHWKAGETRKLYIRATDDISGVNLWLGSRLTFEKVAPAYDRTGNDTLFNSNSNYVRTEGLESFVDEGDDWYSLKFHVSSYALPGEYYLLSLRMDDVAENGDWYFTNQSRDVFDNTTLKVPHITVVNEGTVDNKGPELLSFEKKELTWKIGSEQSIVYTAKDDVSGVADLSGNGCAHFAKVGVKTEATMDLLGIFLCGDAVAVGDHKYSTKVRIESTAEPGEYYLQWFWLNDVAGNQSSYSTDDSHSGTPGEYYSSGWDQTTIPVLKVKLVE